MAFDGVITKSIIKELNTCILGAKVNKIFEPTKNEIILGLYSYGKNYALLLSINPNSCRINLTTHSKPNPMNAPNFCMLLRKYLIGAKIISINSKDLERVVEIVFEGYNEMNDLIIRKLYIEIMNRQSNIIFTNENNIIIDTLKHVDTQNRALLPAHSYEYPNNIKKSFLEITSFEDFFENVKNTQIPLDQKIADSFIGFSQNFVQFSLKKLNINNITYTNEELKKFYDYLKNLLLFDLTNISCENINEKDFTIETKYNNDLLHINFFIDDFYFEKEENETFKNAKSNLSRVVLAALKKCSKKIDNINSKLKECESMDKYRLYGELLTSNLYKLNENVDSVELENYYDNNNKIIIPLDKSISPHKNADKFFKKYNKLKNALEIVSLQKKESERELDYIESLIFSIENAKDVIDLNEIYEEISQNLVTKKDLINNQKNSKKNNHKNDDIKLNKFEENGYTIFIRKK